MLDICGLVRSMTDGKAFWYLSNKDGMRGKRIRILGIRVVDRRNPYLVPSGKHVTENGMVVGYVRT